MYINTEYVSSRKFRETFKNNNLIHKDVLLSSKIKKGSEVIKKSMQAKGRFINYVFELSLFLTPSMSALFSYCISTFFE